MPALLVAVTVPVAVPVSEPLPVQPLTVNVLPLLVAVRLAVVMPVKPSDMPSVDDSEVLVRVKPALLLAVDGVHGRLHCRSAIRSPSSR